MRSQHNGTASVYTSQGRPSVINPSYRIPGPQQTARTLYNRPNGSFYMIVNMVSRNKMDNGNETDGL
ncbi:hypothetical protein XELAEV_18032472mg [Xenopus laevis]|uniref:Uncharacterized protein n=1 Tax=Xenopus laevis TaxID=8355 RepID=A0A974CPL8_XENLA|nr:hypothetical protein XELAEV_18032472mg [Xenopus laevis]